MQDDHDDTRDSNSDSNSNSNSASNPEHENAGKPSQQQDNVIKDTNVRGDLVFAPVQIGTKIETQIVQISSSKITQQELIRSSPYQGLKRFNFKDRDNFFGRDTLIARLLEAVNRSSLSLVLGASGSGKSSAVRAGLIPELKKSLDTETFYDLIFTPGQCPYDAFYRCLRSEEKDYNFAENEAKLALGGEVDTFEKVISTLQKEGERWLIFIDQFEELFTSCNDVGKRNNFIEGLVRIANSNNSAVKIVLAMRADFLEQLSSYPNLGKIINEGNLHLVTDMHKDELQQAIEQPAAKHGVVFEDGLVQQIIQEVEGQKGYLPLLQYTLNLLWQAELKIGNDGNAGIDDRTLNKSSYAALEGVRGALQKQINSIYKALNQDEKVATKQIFIKLVNIIDTESGSKTVSRRANLAEFSDSSLSHTLQTFINENLLVSSSENVDSNNSPNAIEKSHKQIATVEISHEILLSSWGMLKEWIEDEKEAIVLKNWLSGETNRWQTIAATDAAKGNDELLQGARLEQISELRAIDAFKNVGGLRDDENAFIDSSIRWQQQQEKQKKTRRRNAFASMFVFTVVSIGLAGFSFVQLNKVNAADKVRQDEMIRSSWVSINPKELNYEDCGSALDFGLRKLYCEIKPYVDYQKIKTISGLNIFLSGPHSESDVNFEGGRAFGHYNPRFLSWVSENIIVSPDSAFLQEQIESAYNAKIKVVARAFYETRLVLAATDNDFGLFANEYNEASNNYQALMDAGLSNEMRFSSGPISFADITQYYLSDIADETVRAADLGFNLQENCRFVSDYVASVYESSNNLATGEQEFWYLANVSCGFWTRRSIDGTDQEFESILIKLLKTYDAQWLAYTNSTNSF